MAAISRLASLLDGLVNGWLGDPEFDTIVDRDLADGRHRNPTNRADWFTTAFFHSPGELRSECEDAGLQVDGVFGLEGPGWILWAQLWNDPTGRENILRVARAVEQEPAAVGTSAHLLAVTRPRD